MYKIYIETLGCPKNRVDSERFLANFNGSLTSHPRLADLIIVNTCAFIDDATEESIQRILELARLKVHHPEIKILVFGCLVNRYGREKLSELIPEVDGFLPVIDDQKPEDTALFQSFKDASSSCKDLNFPSLTPAYYRYLKLSEGCNNHCSYCLIPSIRGNLRSRDLEDIGRQIGIWSQDLRLREIILIAQDTTRYGDDLAVPLRLVHLLRLIEESPFQGWVRLLYTNPGYFTAELIDFLASSRKVVPYLDMPIQHSHREVLKRMNRRYDTNQLIDLYQQLRARIPSLILRTTVMVGFPYETEKRFEHLLNFIQEYPFDKLGAFVFQPQEGTLAYHWRKHAVARHTKDHRLAELMGIQHELARERNQLWIGKSLRVLVEGRCNKKGYSWVGRSFMDAPDIDGLTYIRSGNELTPGEWVDVTIEKADSYDTFAAVNEGTLSMDGEENCR